MANEKVILITGATGKQGGATLRHLAKRGGFKLRAMTRKPDSDAAKAVAALGAELVAGDFNDAASLERAMTGVWGVFAVQNTWEAGVEGEEEQGKRVAKIARDKGVQHFVYTSVGSADERPASRTSRTSSASSRRSSSSGFRRTSSCVRCSSWRT